MLNRRAVCERDVGDSRAHRGCDLQRERCQMNGSSDMLLDNCI